MTILVTTDTGKLKTFKNVSNISYNKHRDCLELSIEMREIDEDITELVDIKEIRKLEAII